MLPSPLPTVAPGNLDPVLQLTRRAYIEMVAHLVAGLPDEGCGLLGGRSSSDGERGESDTFYPSVNVAASSRVYTIDPLTHLRAERHAEERGSEILGVVHSHTHTEPWPSPTDVAQAPDPNWHYVIVSFRLGEPMARSFRIVDGVIAEEPLVVAD